jgi:hypothetical protein
MLVFLLLETLARRILYQYGAYRTEHEELRIQDTTEDDVSRLLQ